MLLVMLVLLTLSMDKRKEQRMVMHWVTDILLCSETPSNTKNDRRSSGGTLRQKKTRLKIIWVSISIYQHQSALISTNQHQSLSFSLNHDQSSYQSDTVNIRNWLGNYIYRHICSKNLRSVRRLSIERFWGAWGGYVEKMVRGRLQVQELLSELTKGT